MVLIVYCVYGRVGDNDAPSGGVFGVNAGDASGGGVSGNRLVVLIMYCVYGRVGDNYAPGGGDFRVNAGDALGGGAVMMKDSRKIRQPLFHPIYCTALLQ